MSEIYRDRTEGAAARRQELLRRRRDELATMPHAVRRVVVARSARTAAGIALTLGGVALLATLMSPRLASSLASALPGIQPAALSTVLIATWLLGIVAYMMSRARGEHRFAVAMSHYVLPGADLDHDIERLDHERPDEIARQSAHRLEVGSASWIVLGASLVIPATVLYGLRAVVEHGWPLMSNFEDTLAAHGKLFALYGAAGAAGALAMTWRGTRLPSSARAMIALVALILVFAAAVHQPALIGLAAVPMAMAIVIRRLRLERALIAANDPAAGSEMFSLRDTLRAAWRGTRDTIAALAHALERPSTRRTVVTLVALGGFGFGWKHFHHTQMPTQVVPASTSVASQMAPRVGPAGIAKHYVDPNTDSAPYKIAHSLDGVISIELELDGAAVDVPAIDGLGEVPDHWRAELKISVDGGDVALTPFYDTEAARAIEDGGSFEFVAEACRSRVPLNLHVDQHQPGHHHVTIRIRPTLTVALCPPEP